MLVPNLMMSLFEPLFEIDRLLLRPYLAIEEEALREKKKANKKLKKRKKKEMKRRRKRKKKKMMIDLQIKTVEHPLSTVFLLVHFLSLDLDQLLLLSRFF